MNVLPDIRVAALTALMLVTLAVRADDDCERPTTEWQPRTAVEQFARRSGWQIDKLKVDDGCYEIKGRDAEGQRIEVKLDPATLEIVEMESKRPHRDRTDTTTLIPGEHE